MEANRAEQYPVMISVKGMQIYEETDPDETELMTEGRLEVTPGRLCLSYQESALTGMEGTTTRLLVEGPRVTLLRQGTVNSQIIFEEGRQHTSLYETPFGELSVDIRTGRLRHNLTERGGLMEIQYSIAVEHILAGRNRLKVRVRRK